MLGQKNDRSLIPPLHSIDGRKKYDPISIPGIVEL